MIIYGSAVSPFVRKVLVLLAEKGIAHELKAIGLGSADPDFREASPFGKIPALRDGDFTLADSSAIAHYLDAKFPDVPMIPADAQARGKAVWFDEFADTILVPPSGKLFFNLVVAPLFMKRSGDSAAAEAGGRELVPIIDWLEQVVPADGFLVGGQFGLADIAVASDFVNLDHAGWQVDALRWPRLAAYVSRILARPSFATLIEREQRMIARARGAAPA